MKLLKAVYEKVTDRAAPYYYSYSVVKMIGKPIRKFFAQVIAPNIVFNNLRIFIYRLCGFKLGKHTFIGMKCYLDNMCYDLLEIENNVTISYGVYFVCHGKKQGHYPIKIEDGAYIGMRAAVISKNTENKSGGIGCKERNCWSLSSCKQKDSGRRYCGWYSMQSHDETGYLRNKEVSAA